MGRTDPVLVVSPHCDDAVLSCGELLAERPGSMVVTLFAGRPPAGQPLTEWDAAAGFREGDDVMGERRAEDRAALDVLGATPVWLDFCDAQYQCSPDAETLSAALAAVMQAGAPREFFLPLGLFHSDHVLAHDAGRRALARLPGWRVCFYEDAIYRRYRGLLAARLEALRSQGLALQRRALSPTSRLELKQRAVACYRSQLRALSTPGRPGHADAFAPEGYWCLPT